MLIKEGLDKARKMLQDSVERPRLEAEILLAHHLGCGRTSLLLREREELVREEEFFSLVNRRLAHEPVEYITNEVGFYGESFYIAPGALIPRPETETVTEWAIAEVDRLSGGGDPVIAADLGAGSGAIGLSLAFETPADEIWLTDLSADAIAVMRSNLAGLGSRGGRVRVSQGSWFEALPEKRRGRFGLLVSNPPYVTRDEPLPESVAAWEPEMALRAERGGGATGLPCPRGRRWG